MEWKNSLHDFEHTPPEHCWGEIRNQLDQDLPVVRQKLADYAEDPPHHSKQAILKQIRQSAPSPRIWLTRSRSVAAASIAFLLGLSMLYILFSPAHPPKVSASVAGARKGDSMIRMQQAENGYIWLYFKNEAPIRISQKFMEMAPALKDSQHSTVTKWQQKMLESSFAPSGSNFMDIVELTTLLEDEKN